jgi:hypothetical protein
MAFFGVMKTGNLVLENKQQHETSNQTFAFEQ